jgi:hypothetical protein
VRRGSAARRTSVEHPELLRLITWARLEQRLGPAAGERRTQSYRRRLAAIEAAQLCGEIPITFAPAQIVRLIESIAVGWTTATSAFLTTPDDDDEPLAARRDVS